MARQSAKFDADHESVSNVSESSDMTKIHLENGSLIELGRLGNVRYSEYIDGENPSYSEIYRSAMRSVSDIVDSEMEYKFCMIMKANQGIPLTSTEKEEISQFMLKEFDISEVSYSDLGSNSMKISIYPQTDYVKV